MFVPLVPYHAGGAAAAFAGHPQDYEWALAQYLGAGVAACYRGAAVYDSPAARAAVVKWVAFYKRHRAVLIQPVVHLKRPTLQVRSPRADLMSCFTCWGGRVGPRLASRVWQDD